MNPPSSLMARSRVQLYMHEGGLYTMFMPNAPITPDPSRSLSASVRATALALFAAADRVGGQDLPLPFLWRVEVSDSAEAEKHFALHIITDCDCRCFLIRSGKEGPAEILTEWQALAGKDVRVPGSGDLVWDGIDDSHLVIIAAGDLAENTLPDEKWRGAEGYCRSERPLALDPKSLGLVRSSADHNP